MQKNISLKLLPAEAADESAIKDLLASATARNAIDITGFYPTNRSIDARGKQVWININFKTFIQEPFHPRQLRTFEFKEVQDAQNRVIIIGAGPAGLFASLQLIEKGIKPIILERGKDVKARRRDLAILNKEGILNPESNYCFGEGGAGTYSDGKLYTRSNKRGDIERILSLLVRFGAGEQILYESHPHIGTNKLPQIIAAMRKQIVDCGGEFFFEKKVTDFVLRDGKILGVKTSSDETYEGEAVILATGHSARDIFQLLQKKQILIESKAFALGVRIEHPQELIDRIQYHSTVRDPLLPPASYSLVEQVKEKGVFSFCMCPGGIIAAASTSNGELVVNGWSPSKRNNPYSNSGMVVQVDMKDAWQVLKQQTTKGKYQIETSKSTKDRNLENDPLLLMRFQHFVEQQAFEAGGGKFVAPAQRMVDFTQNIISTTLPSCSYIPGLQAAGLNNILPWFINKRLQEAFKSFGKKMRGYYTNEAVVLATESRTSSPVRIPRDNKSLNHPQISNLYPCGEGAGYAGGIVSAAMDGERVANAVIQSFVRSPYL